MNKGTAAGIDVGSHEVKVVIAGNFREGIRVIGASAVDSKGLRHGYVVSEDDVADAIKSAVAGASAAAKVTVSSAMLGIGGVSLEGFIGDGSVAVSRADSEVTDLDLDRVVAESKRTLPPGVRLNRSILHTVPLLYTLDGSRILGRPEGMRGGKLAARVHFVTCLEQHMSDLVHAVEATGIEVEDIVAAPLAASLVNLTKAEKVAGAALLNIGSETVSLVVYEDGIPVSLKVFPIGSTDITNDIALGMRVPLDEAERMKIGSLEPLAPKRKLDEIVEARLGDIFELVEGHLKAIGKNGLLPAGIVLTGGGAGIARIDDLAKAALKLPAARARLSGNRDRIKDATWSVAYGLALLGLSNDSDRGSEFQRARNAGERLFKFIKKYLP